MLIKVQEMQMVENIDVFYALRKKSRNKLVNLLVKS